MGHPDIANFLIALTQTEWRTDRLLLVESEEVETLLNVFAHRSISFYIDRGLKIDPDSTERRCFFAISSLKVRRHGSDRLCDAYNVQCHEFAPTSKRARSFDLPAFCKSTPLGLSQFLTKKERAIIRRDGAKITEQYARYVGSLKTQYKKQPKEILEPVPHQQMACQICRKRVDSKYLQHVCSDEHKKNASKQNYEELDALIDELQMQDAETRKKRAEMTFEVQKKSTEKDKEESEPFLKEEEKVPLRFGASQASTQGESQGF